MDSVRLTCKILGSVTGVTDLVLPQCAERLITLYNTLFMS